MRRVWFVSITALLFGVFSHENNIAYGQAGWPLGKDVDYKISQKYSDTHLGIDIEVKEGTPVYPIKKGKIVKIERNGVALGVGKNAPPIDEDPGRGFGNHVIIKHTLPNGEKRYSSYSHLGTVSGNIQLGQEVGRNDQLGTVGNTGRSSAPHLHLQVDKEINKHLKGLFPVPPYPKEFKKSGLSKPINPLVFLSELEKLERQEKIEKLKREAMQARTEAERLGSLKGLLKETVKGIPKAFDDLEHGRSKGTLPQTIYDASTLFLQTLAETQGYFVYRQRDLEQMKKALDSTHSVAHIDPGHPNLNVLERTVASPNFSDNFSAGLGNWSYSNAYTTSAFGPLTSPDGSIFGTIHTGLGDPANTGLLSKQFNLSVPLNLNISFQYNFVTTEYPEFVGSIFNDFFTAELHTPGGGTINLAGETVNSSTFTSVSGLPTNVLDHSTGGKTSWKTVNMTISAPSGTSELHFHVKDVGDNIFDSATLIDNVSVK